MRYIPNVKAKRSKIKQNGARLLPWVIKRTKEREGVTIGARHRRPTKRGRERSIPGRKHIMDRTILYFGGCTTDN